MTKTLSGARILVTGAAGFRGQALLERLAREDCADVAGPTHAELELRDPGATGRWLEEYRPEIVIHLAARVGGIGANRESPATFWRDNTLMGVSVLEACRRARVRRVVVAGTVCAYPKFTTVPFREAELWDGYPEETNAPYGVAKRALATGLEAYHREFGLRGAFLLPANLYGPRDNFDLETCHVVPAMIRKCEEARLRSDDSVVFWGTGRPTREFLHVADCADAIALAAAREDAPSPMNLGTGREISMAALGELVCTATGFSGTIEWDPARPDGQPRRALDTREALRRLGWRAATSLEDGIAATVAWYRESQRVG